MRTERNRRKRPASGINRRLLFIVCCLLTVAFLGCGKKGDPRAPELATPQTIKNLSAKPDRTGVMLTWSRPTQYVDGKALTDLAAFVIFRKEVTPNCPACPVPYRQLTTVNVEDQERFVKKKQYRFIDQQVAPQAIYRYRVFSQLTDGSLSDPSNEVEVTRSP